MGKQSLRLSDIMRLSFIHAHKANVPEKKQRAKRFLILCGTTRQSCENGQEDCRTNERKHRIFLSPKIIKQQHASGWNHPIIDISLISISICPAFLREGEHDFMAWCMCVCFCVSVRLSCLLRNSICGCLVSVTY